MHPKRNHHRKNNKPPTQAAGAMANCVLPQEVMFNIVTRLPVRSMHRFKSVCKPWRKLFDTPKFMKMHHAQLSRNPENQSAMIYSLTAKYDHTVSLLRIESKEKKPTNLFHPCPAMIHGLDFVGCINGLLCFGYPPLGQLIELWNPALKMSKCPSLPQLQVGEPEMVSLGFGYDDEADDFKVLRIVSVEKNKKGEKISVGVEFYSVNSDSWKTINVGFQFRVFRTKNEAIVNGNPYWVAMVDGNEVLMCFDVKKMLFKIVPMPGLNLNEMDQVLLVDWKGVLAALVSNKKEERVLSLDVWVFDDVAKTGWTKNHSFGPIELKVDRFLQRLQNGQIIGECLDGKLFVFDSENGGVEEIMIDEAEKGSFQVCGYTESLVYMKGMRKVVPPTEEEEKKIDDLVDIFIRSALGMKDGDILCYY